MLINDSYLLFYYTLLVEIYNIEFVPILFRAERKQWAAGLFTGCAVLYACRTVTPLCVAAMAKEMGWDKTQSVSCLLILVTELSRGMERVKRR